MADDFLNMMGPYCTPLAPTEVNGKVGQTRNASSSVKSLNTEKVPKVAVLKYLGRKACLHKGQIAPVQRVRTKLLQVSLKPH